MLEEVIARYSDGLAPDHPRTGSIEYNLGQALTVAGRMDDAVDHLRRAVEIQRAALGPKHPRTVNAMGMLGTALGQIGEVEEGTAVLEETLDALADRPEHPQLPILLNNLGGLYHDADRLEDSLNIHQRANDLLLARGKKKSAVFAMNLSNLGLMQTALQRYEAAEESFLAAIAVYEEVYGPDHPQLWRPNAMLARMYRTTKRATLALPFAKQAVDVLKGVSSDPNEIADAEFELAQVRWAVGRRDRETIELAERARERWRTIDLDAHAQEVDAWLASRSRSQPTTQ